MLKKIAQRLKASHQRLRRAYAAKLSPTQDNFWARVDYYWFDHAILRTFWTNFFEIAPGFTDPINPLSGVWKTLRKWVVNLF